MYKYIDSTVFITENKMPERDILGRIVSGGKGNDFSAAGFDASKTTQPTMDYMRGKGIEDFKAQMRSGFARPNLFRVDVDKVSTDKAAKYRMSCFQTQIPGVSLATTDKDIGFRSVAYQKLFSDMTLGFYVSSGLEEIEFWQGQKDRLHDRIKFIADGSYPEITWKTNALGAENMALISKELNVTHVYISTAGIFDGLKEYYNDFD